MKTIETERLILRPFTMEDVAASYEMNLDKEVSRYTADGGVVSFEEIERRIREDVLGDYAKYGYGRFAVELKAEQKFIGFCGLKFLEDLKEADLGYRLLKDYWGKGYATEAAKASVNFGIKELGIQNIVAFVLEENQNSISVLRKLGFVYEKDFLEDGIVAQKYVLNISSKVDSEYL